MGAASSKLTDAGDVEVEEPAGSLAPISTPSNKDVETRALMRTPSEKRDDYEDVIVSLKPGLGWLCPTIANNGYRHRCNVIFTPRMREQKWH